MLLIINISCTPIGGNDPNPPPACDNTTNNCVISLQWLPSQAYYFCNFGLYNVNTPPLATNYNYTTTASATNDNYIHPSQSPNPTTSYLCSINAKNDEPTQRPGGCSSPGVLKFYWTQPGTTQTISVFSHFDSDVTVDYYDPVDPCGDGRPYFAGVAGIYGATSWQPIPMFTQPSIKN